MTVRQILDDRRTAQLEIKAIEKQIAGCMNDGRPAEYPMAKQPEKVPGKDEFVISLPGTNNPEAAGLQHEDGFIAKLDELRDRKRLLFLTAEAIIESLSDGEARAILRYYYCLGWPDSAIGEEIDQETRNVCKKRNGAVEWLEKNYHGSSKEYQSDIESTNCDRVS